MTPYVRNRGGAKRRPALAPPLVPLTLNPRNAAPVIVTPQVKPSSAIAAARKIRLPFYGLGVAKLRK
jgi:hypothetical protein